VNHEKKIGGDFPSELAEIIAAQIFADKLAGGLSIARDRTEILSRLE